MTLHYPEAEPRSFHAAEPAREGGSEGAANETIVPVYARKPARKKTAGVDKRLLMAIPVGLVALGVGAWAFTAGDSSRDSISEAPLEVAASDLTPTRLAATETLAPEPLAVSEAPLAPAAVPTTTSAPPRITPAARPAPRRVSPVRRAAAPEAAVTVSAERAASPSPIAPVPYEPATVTPVEAPAAPQAVVPTPVLPTAPAEPPVLVIPSTTATTPDGGGA